MKLKANSVSLALWFIFSGIFFILGTLHLAASHDKISFPIYEIPQRGIRTIDGMDTGFSGIQKYAASLKTALAEYIKEYNSAAQKQNKYAAYGYFLAFGTSLVSFFVTFFEKSRQNIYRKALPNSEITQSS